MTGLPAAFVGSATQHGGPLTGDGTPTVLINGRPAWGAEVTHTCPVHGVEIVEMGSETVLFNGLRAARAQGDFAGDFLQGAGPPDQIMQGSPNVLIGTPGIGLASDANKAKFCELYCQLTKDWPNLTPDQRKQRYKAMIAAMAATFGAPPPKTHRGLSPGAAASFDRRHWRINLPRDAWTDNSGPPGGWATLHELRHCEQAFTAIRSHGGKWPRDVPPEVKQAAAEQPLDPDAPEGRFGSLHYDNEMIPEGHDNRQKIINEIVAAAKADPSLTSQRWHDAVDAYYNQPGGADARTLEGPGQCGGCP